MMRFFALFLMLFALASFGGGMGAYAQSTGGTGMSDCDSSSGGGGAAGGAGGSEGKEVIPKVTKCVQNAITEATEKYLEKFSEYMQPIIFLFIGLVVSFFGVRLLGGEGELKKKGFTLLLKIGVVLLFANNFGGFAMNAFGASEQLQTIIVKALPPDSKCSGGGGSSGGGGGGQYISEGGQQVWQALDCVLGRLMGYGPNFALPASIFGLLGSILGSGAIGVSVFAIGAASLLSLIFFVLRCVYIFLTSYMFIGFLLIISPLIIPFLLLEITASIFEAWLKNLMAAIALPGIVFAYLCIVMPVIDDVVQGTSPTSLKSAMGSDQDTENAYRLPTQRFSLPMQNYDPSFHKNYPKIKTDQVFKGNLRNITNPMMSGATDLGSQFSYPSVDYGKRTNGKLWDIGYAMIKVMLTSICLTMLMRAIPDMLGNIVQGGFGLISAANESMPFEDKIKRTFSQAAGGFGGGRGGLTG